MKNLEVIEEINKIKDLEVGAEDVKIADLANNFNSNNVEEVIVELDQKIEKNSTDISNNVVKLSDAVNSTSTTTAATSNSVKKAYDRAEEAFLSAASGKNKIALAISGKGVSANANDSFDTLANKIGQISTGPSGDGIMLKTDVKLEFPGATTTKPGLDINGLTFPINASSVPYMVYAYSTGSGYIHTKNKPGSGYLEVASIGITSYKNSTIELWGVDGCEIMAYGTFIATASSIAIQSAYLNCYRTNANLIPYMYCHVYESFNSLKEIPEYKEVGSKVYFNKETKEILGITPSWRGYFSETTREHDIECLGLTTTYDLKENEIDFIQLDYVDIDNEQQPNRVNEIEKAISLL